MARTKSIVPKQSLGFIEKAINKPQTSPPISSEEIDVFRKTKEYALLIVVTYH